MKEPKKGFLRGRVTDSGMVRGEDGTLYWMRQPDVAYFVKGDVEFKPWYNLEANAWYAINLRKIAKPGKPRKAYQHRY